MLRPALPIQQVLSFCLLIASVPASYALPVLPGNEHPHGGGSVSWPNPAPSSENRLHQHYNDRELGVNHGANSWFANKAWDNKGTNTTFGHCINGINQFGCADPDFGHGFIADRVLFYFDPDFAAPAADYEARVVDAFEDWETGAASALAQANRPDLELGFEFERAATLPTDELFILIQFADFGSNGITGEFDSANRTVRFNTSTSINWHAGAGMPGAGQQDFLSTARHEIGHAIGFGHNYFGNKLPGRSIMWSGPAPLGTRIDIADSDLEGVLALYTQPVPEPSTYAVVAAGLVAVALRRRRRK